LVLELLLWAVSEFEVASMVRAAILGIVQGITEFLPISSSGHLVLVEKLLGRQHADMYMQVFLHFGTLLAIILVYRRKLGGLFASLGRAIARRSMEGDSGNLVYIGYLAVATIPAMILGYAFKDLIEGFFESSNFVAIFLLVTGTVLFFTRRCGERKEKLGFLDSVAVGFSQVLALLPGISRSGITISTGIYRGVSRGEAADFSFMLAVPSIFLVSIYQSVRVSRTGFEFLPQYLLGTVLALIVGYAAIKWLIMLVKRGRFFYFAFYCWFLGCLSLVLGALGEKGGF
jgi:undecaprenyl-diphosphatase